MTAYELSDLIASNRGLIAQTWALFISVHVGLFGVTALSRRKINIFERFLFVPIYLPFMYVSWRAQMDNYAYTERLIDMARDLGLRDAASATPVDVFTPGWIVTLLLPGYALTAMLTVLIILFAGVRREPVE